MRKVFPKTGSFRTRWWWEVPGGLFAFPFDRYFNPSHSTRPEVQRCIVDSDT
jgi:hypothetical protein